MPLAKLNNDNSLVLADPVSQQPQDIPVVVASEDPNYIAISADSRLLNPANLLTNLSGGAWTVDYYSQILSSTSALSGQRPSSNAVNQQYRKIKQLTLRVTDPLSLTQDAETKEMIYVGRALVHSFVPNDGDMMVATIADGSKAAFYVSETVKKAVYRAAAYEIAYQVSSQSEEYLHDLDEKVVETLVWRDDNSTYGKSPLILKEHDDLLNESAGLRKSVLGQYIDRFFSREFSTLLVPEQRGETYDPMLVSFVMQMLNGTDHPLITRIRAFNVQDDSVYTQNHFWKALAHQDESFLEMGFRRTGLAHAYLFNSNPFFSGIRFCGVRDVVYPVDPTPGINGVDTSWLKDTSSYALAPSSGGDPIIFEDPNTGQLPTNPQAPNLYRVTVDDYYVLSENFYAQTNTQSTLETMVRKYLKREAVDLKQLIGAAKLINRWGLVEQFYYTPIVLAIMKTGVFE